MSLCLFVCLFGDLWTMIDEFTEPTILTPDLSPPTHPTLHSQVITGDLSGSFKLWDIRSFECMQVSVCACVSFSSSCISLSIPYGLSRCLSAHLSIALTVLCTYLVADCSLAFCLSSRTHALTHRHLSRWQQPENMPPSPTHNATATSSRAAHVWYAKI